MNVNANQSAVYGVFPPSIESDPRSHAYDRARAGLELNRSPRKLERYLAAGPTGVAPALAMKIERLVRSIEHKREMPPAPDFD